MKYFEPRDINPDNVKSDLNKIDEDFENLCAMLESKGVVNPHLLPVYSFLKKIDYFSEKK